MPRLETPLLNTTPLPATCLGKRCHRAPRAGLGHVGQGTEGRPRCVHDEASPKDEDSRQSSSGPHTNPEEQESHLTGVIPTTTPC